MTYHIFLTFREYDLEVLPLASENVLLKRLGTDKFSRTWAVPPENQNHNHPSKRIVETLCRTGFATPSAIFCQSRQQKFRTGLQTPSGNRGPSGIANGSRQQKFRTGLQTPPGNL
ncbi:MAG: hypothetical protein DRI57_00275 [Deltaproteobacteria bacterium]|nr:MAG: hypothetical protein DRI57_00275 [Deltaproteobacteria bacterium]